MLFTFTKFRKKDFLKILELYCGQDFHTKIYKGALFHTNVGRVMVLNLYSSSHDTLYVYKVTFNYLKGFQSY